LDNQVALPTVQVVENGKPVSNERIDPSVMQFIAQMASLSQLNRTRKLEEAKIPIGTKALTFTVTNTRLKVGLYPPWISFSLRNDGPGSLVVWINDAETPEMSNIIQVNEMYDCDMTYPVIRMLHLRAQAGTTASVRIYGKEGKPE